MTERTICRNCESVMPTSDRLSAPNPFVDGDTIYACPVCRQIDDFLVCCDEPNCNKPASCGWPSKNGYRQTCGEHMEEDR